MFTTFRFISLAILALIAAPGTASADTDGTIAVDGVTRSYVVHVPVHLAPIARLVLAFHGHGESVADEITSTKLSEFSDEYGFIVAYPVGINGGWNDGLLGIDTSDDVGFARALIKQLAEQYHVGNDFVFATGFSNGAVFSQRLACAEGAPVAAIAPISGTIVEDVANGCHANRNVSMLAIHGTKDPFLPFGGGQPNLKKRGNVVSFAGTLEFWARADHCRADVRKEAVPPTEPADDTHAVKWIFPACASGVDVVGYEIVGGGHTIPGGPQYKPVSAIGIASNQLQASRAIVEFFMSRKPPNAGG